MNINDLNDVEEILKCCGYTRSNNSETEYNIVVDPTGGLYKNCCAEINLDIPNGFQDVNPMLFVVIGEIIGNILSGQLPYNVTVSIANWLNLVGQIIETYSAQQQYYEHGPGRYFNCGYKNITNPFCSCEEVNNDANQESNSSETTKTTIENMQKKTELLIKTINEANKKIERLEEEINNLKNK